MKFRKFTSESGSTGPGRWIGDRIEGIRFFFGKDKQIFGIFMVIDLAQRFIFKFIIRFSLTTLMMIKLHKVLRKNDTRRCGTYFLIVLKRATRMCRRIKMPIEKSVVQVILYRETIFAKFLRLVLY